MTPSVSPQGHAVGAFGAVGASRTDTKCHCPHATLARNDAIFARRRRKRPASLPRLHIRPGPCFALLTVFWKLSAADIAPPACSWPPLRRLHKHPSEGETSATRTLSPLQARFCSLIRIGSLIVSHSRTPPRRRVTLQKRNNRSPTPSRHMFKSKWWQQSIN